MSAHDARIGFYAKAAQALERMRLQNPCSAGWAGLLAFSKPKDEREIVSAKRKGWTLKSCRAVGESEAESPDKTEDSPDAEAHDECPTLHPHTGQNL